MVYGAILPILVEDGKHVFHYLRELLFKRHQFSVTLYQDQMTGRTIVSSIMVLLKQTLEKQRVLVFQIGIINKDTDLKQQLANQRKNHGIAVTIDILQMVTTAIGD